MPYVDKVRRVVLTPVVEMTRAVAKCLPTPFNVGDANWLITNIILVALPLGSYSEYNAAIGLLECIKQELYRRMIAPYEDSKCLVNGDVYPTTKS